MINAKIYFHFRNSDLCPKREWLPKDGDIMNREPCGKILK